MASEIEEAKEKLIKENENIENEDKSTAIEINVPSNEVSVQNGDADNNDGCDWRYCLDETW